MGTKTQRAPDAPRYPPRHLWGREAVRMSSNDTRTVKSSAERHDGASTDSLPRRGAHARGHRSPERRVRARTQARGRGRSRRGPSSPTRPPRQAPSLARLRAPAAREAADSERGSPAPTCLRGAGPVHPITFDRFRVDVSTASQTYSAQNRVLESLCPKQNTHRNHSQHQTRPARRMSDRPPGRSPKP